MTHPPKSVGFLLPARAAFTPVVAVEMSPCCGRPERTISRPVFDGRRLDCRGMDWLYCVAEDLQGETK
jgi:hypothetical protein